MTDPQIARLVAAARQAVRQHQQQLTAARAVVDALEQSGTVEGARWRLGKSVWELTAGQADYARQLLDQLERENAQ